VAVGAVVRRGDEVLLIRRARGTARGERTHLLFVAKNLERVGDHATNIAEMVYYASTGQHMADRPGKSPK